MLKKIPPHETQSWQRLAAHSEEIQTVHMRDLFAKDPERFNNFSIVFNDLLVDYSKNRITEHSLDLLITLAEEVELQDAIVKMFAGERINTPKTVRFCTWHCATGPTAQLWWMARMLCPL